jgi:hypothetical protein
MGKIRAEQIRDLFKRRAAPAQVERDAMAEQVATCAHCGKPITKASPNKPWLHDFGGGEWQMNCLAFDKGLVAEPQAGAQVPSQDEIPDRIRPSVDAPLIPGLTQGESNWYARLQGEFHEACVYENPRSVLNLLETIQKRGQQINKLAREVVAERKRLNSITAYVLEAQQTPITTRESILAAPQVEVDSTRRSEAEVAWTAYCAETWKDGRFDEGMEYWDWSKERFHRLEAELKARKQTELTLFDEYEGLKRLVLSETGGGK